MAMSATATAASELNHKGQQEQNSPMSIGELVGRGRTSDVYAYGPGAVIKISHNDVPDDWPGFEARQTNAVRAIGAPAPRVLDLVDIDGRSAIVFERIDGPSLWQQMLDSPADIDRLAGDFAAIQRSLLGLGIPQGLPDLVDRLIRKIANAPGLTDAERAEARLLVSRLPRGAALLHGDLHPGNILMGAKGPVVIDWFDATIGHPMADINRSSILMQPDRSAELDHLPGSTVALLETITTGHERYFAADIEAAGRDMAAWRAVIAAGRLAERAESDATGLLNLWRQRPATSSL